ncbi:hypothetical protein [uncultured Methanolobus sp.]|uniref:hypothetical protein n=1 Tax=uncultured Methanolobus sp. TaxID=218300 RepID=UPI0029C99B7C|nr:hypothetical protein [uncultured Methanolobus sp.]
MTQYSKKTEIIFAALAGVLYTFFGIIHIIGGIGISSGFADMLFTSGDILGGFCLVVIGAVFLYGTKELLQGINAGVSFIYVGVLMSFVFMAAYLLIMGGNLLDSFIIPEDYEGWNVMESFRPGIYLGILSIVGLLQWKDNFSSHEVLAFRE